MDHSTLVVQPKFMLTVLLVVLLVMLLLLTLMVVKLLMLVLPLLLLVQESSDLVDLVDQVVVMMNHNLSTVYNHMFMLKLIYKKKVL